MSRSNPGNPFCREGEDAAPDRTDADRQNDKKREAEKLLTFVGPKPGWRVLDMAAGAGYSTELMARAVAHDAERTGAVVDAPDERRRRERAPRISLVRVQ